VIGKGKIGKDLVVLHLMRCVCRGSADKSPALAIKIMLLMIRSEQMEQEVEL